MYIHQQPWCLSNLVHVSVFSNIISFQIYTRITSSMKFHNGNDVLTSVNVVTSAIALSVFLCKYIAFMEYS